MPNDYEYMMENPEEIFRLELKTRIEDIREQALWGGVKPGMRLLDAGCGPGKTTAILRKMTEPGGSILGVDYSEKRIKYAKQKYGAYPTIDFQLKDLRNSIDNLGYFDLIFARFVLEYNRKESFKITKHLTSILKPGGIMCLIDLDYNCLTHYELPTKMEDTITSLSRELELEYNFDPYVGRKLYAYLFDLGYEEIELDLRAHHLFYGRVGENDTFNWLKKVEVMSKKKRGLFKKYPGGNNKFFEDFKSFFMNPRRFTYTPLILCKGRKSA